MVENYFSKMKFLSLALFLCVVTSTVIFAAPLETVTNTNDAGAGSLRQAISDVDPGGQIVFNLPGAGPHTININSTLIISKSMTITGPGAGLLTINGAGGMFRGIQVVDGLPTLSEVIISGLTLDGGVTTFGGILNSENLTLNSIVVTGYGSAVVNFGASSEGSARTILNLNDSLVTANSNIGVFSLPGQAQTSPGGTVGINRTTIKANGGPGIVNFGAVEGSVVSAVVVVNKSTISMNTQGIVNEGSSAAGAVGGTLEVNNSTISSNNGDGIQTNGGSNGGSGATTRVSSSTVTGNAFIGLINFGSDPQTEVKNSIVSENAINDCGALDGVFTPLGVNFSTDDTCPGFSQVSQAQLNLDPLQDNGGPTETHALNFPSVAINAVSDCTFIDGVSVHEDQRCFLRIEENCDAGAFEFGAPEQLPRSVPALSTWGIVLTVALICLIALYNYRRKLVV